MANPNIFQSLVQPARSAIDYSSELENADALRTRNALQSLNLQQQQAATQQALQERNALQRIAATSGGNRDTLIAGLRNSGLPGLMSQADALEQSGAKLSESRAKAAKDTADAGATTQKSAIELHQQHLQGLSSVNTPDDAVNWIVAGVQSGALPAQGLQQGLQRLQQAAQTPEGFAQWKQQTAQNGLTIQQQMEQTAAKPTEVRLGNVVKMIDTNPRSATFGKEVTPQQEIGVSPDTTVREQGEDRRAGLSRKTQLQVAGLDPDGKPSGDLEAEAQAVAAGKLPAPTGFAATKPRAQQLIARVMQINPDFDATSYGAKQKLARDFASGPQGNAMRSFAVAGQHLDQLGELVDALGNGNTQLLNKLGNAFKEQTGNPAPTNFDAAKDVVSKEVVKAIVAGGGGVAERQELSDLMSKAKSPAQLKGVITQYRSLMAAQHDALLQQRRAGGLPDSTLPDYTGGYGAKPKSDVRDRADKILSGGG